MVLAFDARMGEFEFLISGGSGQAVTRPFPSGRFVVGVGPSCQMRFEGYGLLPTHAEVLVDNRGQPWVRDLTGRGLVWVDGTQTQQAMIPPGSVVRLGDLELVVRQAEPPANVALVPTSSEASARDTAVRSTMLAAGYIIDGRYSVVGKLAAGGMGEVYRAEHIELKKPVAIKVMLPELSSDPEFAARFKREAIAASRIGQQNIIDISDFGQIHDGRFFFAMEYLDGPTLATLVRRQGAMGAERATVISLQVARALAAAHSAGIVHRDLKPENIMVLQRPGQPDFVKVLDFGVAKVAAGHGHGGQTAIGVVVGTPQYMSPEQAKALSVDARSDIYSLGLITYELLCGRPTFSGETPSILMVKHVTELPPPLEPGPLQEVPAALEELVFQMLEKAPGARPQTMYEVVERLASIDERLSAGKPLRLRGAMATPSVSSGGVLLSGTPLGPTPLAARSPPRLHSRPALSRVEPRWALGVVAFVALVLVGGAGAFYALSRPPQVVVLPKEVVLAPPKVIDAPQAPAKGERVVLTVKTDPSGAEVFEGDASVGLAPLSIRDDRGVVVELTFVLKGYKTFTKKVRLETEREITVQLEKEEAPPRPRPTVAKGRPQTAPLDDPETELKPFPDKSGASVGHK